MPIIIRPYRDEDWPQVAAVWSLAFFGGRAIERGHRVLRHEARTTFVAEDEEGIVGGLNLIPMPIGCRGAWLPGGGVGAVAVAPEHRRQGAGSSMMHWLVGEMRRRGMVISALHAANVGFYRGFGYALSGARAEFCVPLHLLPRLNEDLPIHRLTAADWPELAPAYEGFAARYSGAIAREGLGDSLVWRLGEEAPTIYAVGDPVEAYAILHLNMKFDEPQKVAELVWSTPRGWRAILGALRMLCCNAASLAWCEPPDGPYAALHAERGAGIGGWLPPMFRLLDIPRAFAALAAPEGEGSFTVEIEDELIAANRRLWRVAWSEGHVVAEPSPAAGDPDLALGIGALTQAVLGQPDLATLARNGAVEVRRPEALATACRLLPPHPTYCIDFF